MSAPMLQNDILHIGSSLSADLNIKKWWRNFSALYVNYSLKHAKNSGKKRENALPQVSLWEHSMLQNRYSVKF